MADYLIKGQEKVEKCFDCPCVNSIIDGKYYCAADDETRSVDFFDKPDWCPLVELEPVYKKDGRRYIFAMWAEVPEHYPREEEANGQL